MSYEEHRVGVRAYGTLPSNSPLLVAVPSVNSLPKRLHTLVAADFFRMAAAMKADLDLELRIASGWRPHRWKSRSQYEAYLRANYGSIAEGRRWLAYQSPHETGLAMDIGVSVFEPLATAFAEACLAAFVEEHLSIGESIRRARLHVLAQGNPLGLVYVPFVLSTLRLTHRS